MLSASTTAESLSYSAMPGTPAALIVAHPGHELRIYGWLERTRPLVYVLTDGSGHGAEARIESTKRVLCRTHASAGSLFGRFSDRALYAAMLGRRFDVFLGLADELAAALVASGVEYVVGDAVEGYNPSHDVCRLIVDSAVRLAGTHHAQGLLNFDFLLTGPPNTCPEELRARAIWIRLDDDALERKLEAAHSYPELAGEVEAALAQYGREPFRVECLRPVRVSPPDDRPAGLPFYERHGEKRVAEGVYAEVLRYRDHVLPLIDALWNHCERHG